MTTFSEQIDRLVIPPEKKIKPKMRPMRLVIILLLIIALGIIAFLTTRSPSAKSSSAIATTATNVEATASKGPVKSGDALLTVSGYIIPRARIEISPRFMGTVRTINVKKGDRVKKDDVMVRLEDNEQQARLMEAQGHVAVAEANLTNAETNLKRQMELSRNSVDSARSLDDAKRARDASLAEVTVAKGQVMLAQTYLDWCTIRAPIDGTILEKLVDPDELVVPQSFGGARGPSTALVSLADLNDLQVEIDLNEADLSKIHLKQRCRISPEAYLEKKYGGYVAEIAPEANRSKGTLQIKVQIDQPDLFLTPELTAKVEFLAD